MPYSRCDNPYVSPHRRCYGVRGFFSVPFFTHERGDIVMARTGHEVYTTTSEEFIAAMMNATKCVVLPRAACLLVNTLSPEDKEEFDAWCEERRQASNDHQDSTEGREK